MVNISILYSKTISQNISVYKKKKHSFYFIKLEDTHNPEPQYITKGKIMEEWEQPVNQETSQHNTKQQKQNPQELETPSKAKDSS